MRQMEDALRYWVWLSQCFPCGSDKPCELLEKGAAPEELFQKGREFRASLGVLQPRELNRMDAVSLEVADLILRKCREENIWVLTLEDELYPEALRHIYGAPIVLYGKGRKEALCGTPCLTVVGTRKCSEYAKSAAANISYRLSKGGITIVSGCAVGIDEYAHRGAVKAGGCSIGVMGCGLAVDYPAPNRELKEYMLLRGGALISEYPPGTPALGRNFPVRNRILSALSDGVFVVQAPERSGSLITAELAVEQGKTVFCLPPCNIFDPLYMGVVPFLRDGAKAVYSAEDILEEYEAQWGDKINRKAALGKLVSRGEQGPSPLKPSAEVERKVAEEPHYQPSRETRPAEPVPEELQEIYRLLAKEPRPMDGIIRESGKKPQEVLAALTELELLGLVQAYPGRRYGQA